MLLLDTILLRPYVFVFFLIYAIGCSLQFGLKRMALFGAAGYCIAWLSEFASIHSGFPYGMYYYIEQTAGQELWVLGVPFMDSLSYVFLAYASYSLALLVIAPMRRGRGMICLLETRKIRNSFFTALLGAVFFVYLDIIIDPVALRGDRWFLGRIYGYPDGGAYFGVPLSNFAGWLITGFVMVSAFQRIDRLLSKRNAADYFRHRYAWWYWVGPLLYAVVLLFNLAVTFFIGEHTLGIVGVFIVLLPAVLIYTIIRIKLKHGKPEAAADAPREHVPGPAGMFSDRE